MSTSQRRQCLQLLRAAWATFYVVAGSTSVPDDPSTPELVTARHAEVGAAGMDATEDGAVPIAMYMPMRYHKEDVRKTTGWGFVAPAVAALRAYTREWTHLSPMPRGRGRNVSVVMCDICPSEQTCAAEDTFSCAHRALFGNQLAGQHFSTARAAIGGGLFMSDANVPQKAAGIPAALFLGGFGPNGQTLPLTVSLAPAATSITVTALEVLVARGYTRVSYVACDTPEDLIKGQALAAVARNRGVQLAAHYFPKEDTAVGAGQKGEPQWRELLAAMFQFDARAHVLDMDSRCPHLDIMYWLEDNGRVGTGFVWIGTFDLSIYENYYLKAVATGNPRRYNFGRPFDGFILLQANTEGGVLAKFWNWWLTAQSRKEEVFGWVAPYVRDGAFSRNEAMLFLFEPKGYYAFDAVWAMLLAIDSATQKYGVNFTSGELYEQLINLDFPGASGRVKFDSDGSRLLELRLMQVVYKPPGAPGGVTTATRTTTVTTSGTPKCTVPALTDTVAVTAYMGCIIAACEDAANSLILALTGFKLTSCGDAAQQGYCSTPLSNFTSMAPPGIKMDVVCPRSCKGCGGEDASAIPVPECRVPSNVSQVSVTYYLQCLRVSCASAPDAGVQRITGGAHASCAALLRSVGGDCQTDLVGTFRWLPAGTRVGDLCPKLCPSFCNERPTTCIMDDWFESLQEGGNFALCARLACINIVRLPEAWGSGDCATGVPAFGCHFDLSVVASNVQSPFYNGWLCPSLCPGFCAYTQSSSNVTFVSRPSLALTQIGGFFGSLTLLDRNVTFYNQSDQWPLDKNRGCPTGQVYDPRSSMCYACEAGKYAEQTGLSSCSTCRSGTFSLAQADKCEPCYPGRFSATASSSVCDVCPKGHYSSKLLETECQNCAPGKFAPTEGSSDCSECNRSFYQDQPGQSACQSCPDLMEADWAGAKTIADCRCQQGSYSVNLGEDGRQVCRRCPDWCVCAGGDDPPLQAPGFFVSEVFDGEQPRVVVTCRSVHKCPAGRLLGTCSDHHRGLACDECSDFFYQGDGGPCLPCASASGTRPAILAASSILVLSLVLVARSLRSSKTGPTRQSRALYTLIMSASLAFNALQTLGAFLRLGLVWPASVAASRQPLSLFELDVQLLRFECIVPINPLHRYLAALLAYPLFALTFRVAFAVGSCYRPLHRYWMWNTLGKVFLTTFLSVSLGTVQPWLCNDNPDGTSAMESARSVICWSDQLHFTMIALSVPALLIYVAGFFALIAWVCVNYPSMVLRKTGPSFLRRFAFLFENFHPHKYYYSVVWNARSMLLAATPIVWRLGEVQAVVMTLILLVSLCLTCHLQPWRSSEINALDAVSTLLLASVLHLGAVTSARRDAADSLLLVLLSLLFGAASLSFLLNLWRVSPWRPRPYAACICHHQSSSGSLGRWVANALGDHLTGNVLLDSDVTAHDPYLIVDIVGSETKNLVVLLAPETLRLVWCACQVVAASRSNVQIIPVVCDGFQPVTEDFLSGIGSTWSDLEKSEFVHLGIETAQVEQAYRALLSLQTITLRKNSAIGDMDNMLKQVWQQCELGQSKPVACFGSVFERRRSSNKALSSSASHRNAPKVLLAVDMEDLEAVCSARTLRDWLEKIMQTTVALLDAELLAGSNAFGEAWALLFLLSRASLQRPRMMTVALASQEAGTLLVLPVVVDAKFVHPDDPCSAQRLAEPGAEPGPAGQPPPGPGPGPGPGLQRLLSDCPLHFSGGGTPAIQAREASAIAARLSRAALGGGRPQEPEEQQEQQETEEKEQGKKKQEQEEQDKMQEQEAEWDPSAIELASEPDAFAQPLQHGLR